VISDRPEIGEILKTAPEIRRIAQIKFAGDANGSRVFWDNREPVGGRPGEHMRATPMYPSVVRVSSKINAIDACATLLFELHNYMADREIDRLRNTSPDQQTSRATFAESIVRCEFEAILKTKELFRKHPLPVQDSNDCPFYSDILIHDEDFSIYKTKLMHLAEGEYDPFKFYSEFYDEIIQARRKQTTRSYGEVGVVEGFSRNFAGQFRLNNTTRLNQLLPSSIAHILLPPPIPYGQHQPGRRKEKKRGHSVFLNRRCRMNHR
jgi:hypothetical protein